MGAAVGNRGSVIPVPVAMDENTKLLARVGTYDDGAQLRPAVGMTAATKVVRRFLREELDANGMGSRDFDGGQIYVDRGGRPGECVAVVTYNGRVWAPGEKNPEGLHVPSWEELLVDG